MIFIKFSSVTPETTSEFLYDVTFRFQQKPFVLIANLVEPDIFQLTRLGLDKNIVKVCFIVQHFFKHMFLLFNVGSTAMLPIFVTMSVFACTVIISA